MNKNYNNIVDIFSLNKENLMWEGSTKNVFASGVANLLNLETGLNLFFPDAINLLFLFKEFKALNITFTTASLNTYIVQELIGRGYPIESTNITKNENGDGIVVKIGVGGEQVEEIINGI